jgi:hypothetical protein
MRPATKTAKGKRRIGIETIDISAVTFAKP